MNEQSNTTAPAGKATADGISKASRDTAVANAMRDLENDIHEIGHMSRILGEMLEHCLVEIKTGGGRLTVWEKRSPIKVALNFNQMETLSFAWNDLISRTSRLRRQFNDACDAGGEA